jgi:hypothetical protein
MAVVNTVAVPAALSAHAQRVADAFTARTGVAVDATELLTGRAALLGLSPRGRISAGGATRLLPAADGWCAVTLSRAEDIDAVPALIESEAIGPDPWPQLQRWAAQRPASAAVQRARLLGMPAAVLGETAAAPPRVRSWGRPGGGVRDLLVIDLSSMWAGPLCGQLLRRMGATVVKVESRSRPDGTRSGPTTFFDWMNHGKLSYVADFGQPVVLKRLLSAADVVIEGSRPAALIRRGLGPAGIGPRDGRVWLRITGHGTDGEQADRVAFGDDAAVSAGLVEYDSGGPVFVGDAIADPLTGLHAAAAVADSLARGGGELIEISMAATAAGYVGLTGGPRSSAAAPEPGPAASGLGADHAAVQALLDERSSMPC